MGKNRSDTILNVNREAERDGPAGADDQFHCIWSTGSKTMWWMPYEDTHDFYGIPDFYSLQIHFGIRNIKNRLQHLHICSYAGWVWVFMEKKNLMSSLNQCNVFFPSSVI